MTLYLCHIASLSCGCSMLSAIMADRFLNHLFTTFATTQLFPFLSINFFTSICRVFITVFTDTKKHNSCSRNTGGGTFLWLALYVHITSTFAKRLCIRPCEQSAHDTKTSNKSMLSACVI